MAALRQAGGKDRWGLRPVRRGRVRGQIHNLRRSDKVGQFGSLLVFEFDLFVDEGQPPVPVEMIGADFTHEPREGMLVETPDPTPDLRPIAARRLDFPPKYEFEIVSYYPGRDDPPRSVERLRGLLVLALPFAVAGVLLGLYYAFYG